jgi:hypothetical protein
MHFSDPAERLQNLSLAFPCLADLEVESSSRDVVAPIKKADATLATKPVAVARECHHLAGASPHR